MCYVVIIINSFIKTIWFLYYHLSYFNWYFFNFAIFNTTDHPKKQGKQGGASKQENKSRKNTGEYMHEAVTDCGMRKCQDRRMSQRLARPLSLSSLLRV